MVEKTSALRDGNSWIKILEITEELWKKTMQETLTNVLKLLDASKKLLDIEGDEAICGGLYTYAVEEYGKLLLLRKYIPRNGLVDIKYKDEFRNHSKKFEEAIMNLPKVCKVIGRIGFEEGFEDGFERIDTVADFEARMAVFYTDFDDSGIDLKPRISSDKLKMAMDELRKIANNTTIP